MTGRPGLDPARADLIVAGLAVAAGVAARIEAREILVSADGIREGLLLESAQVPSGPGHRWPRARGIGARVRPPLPLRGAPRPAGAAPRAEAGHCRLELWGAARKADLLADVARAPVRVLDADGTLVEAEGDGE